MLLFYIAINSLFILKYAARITKYAYLFPVIYTAVILGIIFLYFRFLSQREKRLNFLLVLITLGGISGIVALHTFIDPYSIQLTRWSAIHNFFVNLFNGEFPYNAHTHMGGYGSPFPVWQAFHLPFYLLGNVGFGMIFTFVLLVASLLYFVKEKKTSVLYLILLLVSPAFWYEAATISDLFYNFILVFLAIQYIQKKEYCIANNWFVLGTICGLFLSTRLTIVIPFFIYLFPQFPEATWRTRILFVATIIVVFIITFLPFLFWDSNTLLFFKYNPFVLQSRQGSLLELIAIGLFSIFLAMKWRGDFIRFNSYTSYSMLLLVVVTFLHRMIDAGFQDSLFSSSFDITYFNMTMPFLLYSLSAGMTNDNQSLQSKKAR